MIKNYCFFFRKPALYLFKLCPTSYLPTQRVENKEVAFLIIVFTLEHRFLLWMMCGIVMNSSSLLASDVVAFSYLGAFCKRMIFGQSQGMRKFFTAGMYMIFRG
jgi:hypothetical protein